MDGTSWKLGKFKYYVLDDKGSDDHASRSVRRPDNIIVQTLVVNLLIFRLWKPVAHLHSPICLRHTLQGTLHLIEGHLAVQGYVFHVGWSSFNIKVSSFFC